MDVEKIIGELESLIRAALQRKPSGDAVKLAEMVKDWEGAMADEDFRSKYHLHSKQIVGKCLEQLADSILAQAKSAAGDTKEELCECGHVKSCHSPNCVILGNLCRCNKFKARVPAADLLTAEERKAMEDERSVIATSICPKRKAIFSALDRLAPAPSAATPDPFAKWGKYGEDWAVFESTMSPYTFFERDSDKMCQALPKGGGWARGEHSGIAYMRTQNYWPMKTESEARAFLAQHPLPTEMQ